MRRALATGSEIAALPSVSSPILGTQSLSPWESTWLILNPAIFLSMTEEVTKVIPSRGPDESESKTGLARAASVW